MRLIIVIFLSLIIYSCDSLDYLNYKANSIQSEAHRKLIVSKYQHNSRSSLEGYLVDMLVNNHIYENQLNEFRESEVIFFYQSHEFLKIFLEDRHPKSLELSLEMINRAIKADPQNAYNYFFKSFLLFKKGEKIDADRVFLEGLNKPKLKTYQEEGCYYFALFLKKAGLFQPNNAFMLLPYINKLFIVSEFHFYFSERLILHLKNEATEDTSKKIAGNILCSLASGNKKIFTFIIEPQRNYFLYVIKKSPEEQKYLFSCGSEVNSAILKPHEDLKEIVNNFRSKKDLKILDNSEFWKEMEEISK